MRSCGEARGVGLRERPALGAQQHDVAPGAPQRLHRGEQGLGLQHHAPAAAERVVVRDAVPTLGVVAQVDHPDVDRAALPGHAEHRLRRAPRQIIPGKSVTTSIRVTRPSSTSPSGGRTTTRRPARSTRSTMAATAGRSHARPSRCTVQ